MYTIKNPEYVDVKKTRIRMTLVNENGAEQIAEFTVPEGRARGVNPYWDKILDEFDERAMRNRRNNIEVRRQQEAVLNDKRRKASIENDRLRQLFDTKMKCFSLPFVDEASDVDKAAVRRAPDFQMLNLVITTLAMKYMQDKGMTFIDLFDLIDDMQYAKEQEGSQPVVM